MQAYELEDFGARDDAPYREILHVPSLSAGLYFLPAAYSLALRYARTVHCLDQCLGRPGGAIGRQGRRHIRLTYSWRVRGTDPAAAVPVSSSMRVGLAAS